MNMPRRPPQIDTGGSEWIMVCGVASGMSLTLWSYHVHELPSSASVEPHDMIVPDDTLAGLSDAVHLHLTYAFNNSLRVEECHLGLDSLSTFNLVDIVCFWSASLDRAPWLLWTAAHIGKITTTMSCKTDQILMSLLSVDSVVIVNENMPKRKTVYSSLNLAMSVSLITMGELGKAGNQSYNAFF